MLNSSLVADIYVGDDGKLHKVIGGADTVLNFNSAPSFGEETKSIKYSRLNAGGDTLTITFSYTILGIKKISWSGGKIGLARPIVNYSISGKSVTISTYNGGDYGTFTDPQTIFVTITYLK